MELTAIAPHQPDTGLATYQVVVSMPLPLAHVAWLLVELHRASGQPVPTRQIAADLAVLGPVLSWQPLQAILGVDSQRMTCLQTVFGSPDLPGHLSVLLAAMADTPDLIGQAPAVSPDPTPPQWPRLPAPPPHHPLGDGVPFPPRVAQALGVDLASVSGVPIALDGFPFSSQIVHFREAVKRPTPAEAVVIGGGYVGAEVALGWAMDGATVTMIERGARLMPQYYDDEIATVQGLLADCGVRICVETDAVGWVQRGEKVVVTCVAGGGEREVAADLVLVAVGVRRLVE